MQTSRVTIRNATIKDLPSVYRLEKISFPDPYPYLLLLQLLLRNPETFIVAESEGDIVGYAASSIESKSVGHVISIAVLPSLRRRGIASMLMDTLEKRMIEAGAISFYLEVSEDNIPAQNLYAKRGYLPKALLRSYYSTGKDAIRMEKRA
jgi:ribosomal-protein-alanine N-acetyltransferase